MRYAYPMDNKIILCSFSLFVSQFFYITHFTKKKRKKKEFLIKKLNISLKRKWIKKMQIIQPKMILIESIILYI